uniref:Uncharacterized protein n=1 Tax=Cacopsylla melanoneura TaxID=428564 RepID=A0A8D8WLT2_9HEMI
MIFCVMRRTKFPRNPEKLFGEESRKRAYVTLCPFSRSVLNYGDSYHISVARLWNSLHRDIRDSQNFPGEVPQRITKLAKLIKIEWLGGRAPLGEPCHFK